MRDLQGFFAAAIGAQAREVAPRSHGGETQRRSAVGSCCPAGSRYGSGEAHVADGAERT